MTRKEDLELNTHAVRINGVEYHHYGNEAVCVKCHPLLEDKPIEMYPVLLSLHEVDELKDAGKMALGACHVKFLRLGVLVGYCAKQRRAFHLTCEDHKRLGFGRGR